MREERTADDERLDADMPQAERLGPMHEAGGFERVEESMRRRRRQTDPLREVGERHAAIGVGKPFEECQAAREALALAGGTGIGASGRRARAFSGGRGARGDHGFEVYVEVAGSIVSLPEADFKP